MFSKMKSIFSSVFLFGILIAIIMAAPSPEDDKRKMLDECKNVEKASDDDVRSYLNPRLAQGPRVKCLLACMYEKSGLIKDGQIQPVALKMEISMRRETNPEQADDIINECQSINGLRCEQAAQLKECLNKTMLIQHLN